MNVQKYAKSLNHQDLLNRCMLVLPLSGIEQYTLYRVFTLLVPSGHSMVVKVVKGLLYRRKMGQFFWCARYWRQY